MVKNYTIKIKENKCKWVKFVRIIVLILFAIAGIIMFCYSLRYFVYLLIFIFMLLFRLKIKERDGAGFVDAVCSLERKEHTINITVNFVNKRVKKSYSIEYNDFKVFTVENDGKVEMLFKQKSKVYDQYISLYILSEEIEEWEMLKSYVEKRKKDTQKYFQE